MYIYHAGDAEIRGFESIHESIENKLCSYAYPRVAEGYIQRALSASRIIIDSGAFTAFTSGKAIDPIAYGEWALDFKMKYGSKVKKLSFMNLDVIGDQAKSWRNQEVLDGMGLYPIPVVTFGAKLRDLERAIEYPYMALGGLVPYSTQKEKLQAWLDFCFKFFVSRYESTSVMPRVHLLGVARESLLLRYPAYSADSTLWLLPLRYARSNVLKIKGISYKEETANLFRKAVREELLNQARIQSKVTAIWARRGVVWND